MKFCAITVVLYRAVDKFTATTEGFAVGVRNIGYVLCYGSRKLSCRRNVWAHSKYDLVCYVEYVVQTKLIMRFSQHPQIYFVAMIYNLFTLLIN